MYLDDCYLHLSIPAICLNQKWTHQTQANDKESSVILQNNEILRARKKVLEISLKKSICQKNGKSGQSVSQSTDARPRFPAYDFTIPRTAVNTTLQ